MWSRGLLRRRTARSQWKLNTGFYNCMLASDHTKTEQIWGTVRNMYHDRRVVVWKLIISINSDDFSYHNQMNIEKEKKRERKIIREWNITTTNDNNRTERILTGKYTKWNKSITSIYVLPSWLHRNISLINILSQTEVNLDQQCHLV